MLNLDIWDDVSSTRIGCIGWRILLLLHKNHHRIWARVDNRPTKRTMLHIHGLVLIPWHNFLELIVQHLQQGNTISKKLYLISVHLRRRHAFLVSLDTVKIQLTNFRPGPFSYQSSKLIIEIFIGNMCIILCREQSLFTGLLETVLVKKGN